MEMSSKVQSGGLDSDSRKFVSEIHQEGSFFLMTALAEKMPLALERLLLLWRAGLMCWLIYQIKLKATLFFVIATKNGGKEAEKCEG